MLQRPRGNRPRLATSVRAACVDDTRRHADELLALTSDRTLVLLQAACEHAGRTLTDAEMRGLFRLQ